MSLDASKGETKIICLLMSMGLVFVREHTLPGCVYKRQLTVDFYVPSHNVVIEYDGKQHFKAVRRFGGRTNTAIQKARDEAKDKYCVENNLTIIRVRYDKEILGFRRIAGLVPDFDFDGWLCRFNGQCNVRQHLDLCLKWEGEVDAEIFQQTLTQRYPKHELAGKSQQSVTKALKSGKLGGVATTKKVKGKVVYVGVSFADDTNELSPH